MGQIRQCDHPVTPENTYRRRNGERDGCLACRRSKDRATYAAKKDKKRTAAA